MKLDQIINENGSITTHYRELESTFKDLKLEVANKKLNVKFEETTSGNIWELCRVLEKNIKLAKSALAQ